MLACTPIHLVNVELYGVICLVCFRYSIHLEKAILLLHIYVAIKRTPLLQPDALLPQYNLLQGLQSRHGQGLGGFSTIFVKCGKCGRNTHGPFGHGE